MDEQRKAKLESKKGGSVVENAVVTIVSAVISATAALLVCLIQTRAAERRQEALREENINLITYKIDILTDRVDKHNNLIERMYKAEEDIAVIQTQIQNQNQNTTN